MPRAPPVITAIDPVTSRRFYNPCASLSHLSQPARCLVSDHASSRSPLAKRLPGGSYMSANLYICHFVRQKLTQPRWAVNVGDERQDDNLSHRHMRCWSSQAVSAGREKSMTASRPSPRRSRTRSAPSASARRSRLRAPTKGTMSSPCAMTQAIAIWATDASFFLASDRSLSTSDCVRGFRPGSAG
jgi:hypothetical protein